MGECPIFSNRALKLKEMSQIFIKSVLSEMNGYIVPVSKIFGQFYQFPAKKSKIDTYLDKSATEFIDPLGRNWDEVKLTKNFLILDITGLFSSKRTYVRRGRISFEF